MCIKKLPKPGWGALKITANLFNAVHPFNDVLLNGQ